MKAFVEEYSGLDVLGIGELGEMDSTCSVRGLDIGRSYRGSYKFPKCVYKGHIEIK